MANAKDVAKWFVNNIDRNSGEALTHLKLQKLIYFAQAWHLLAYDRPLFPDDIQAWGYGPVVPSVYKEFAQYGFEAIPPLQVDVDVFDDEARVILAQVLNIYGEFSPRRLVAMTHAEEPWIHARGNLPEEARCEEVIPQNSIRDYYLRTYGEMANGEEAAQG